MRQILITILSLLILIAGAAVDSQGATRKKSRTTSSKKKSTKRRTAPVVYVNTDSINAARRAQAINDSLNDLRAKVAEGDPTAINDLGMWYYTGHNVERDYAQAVQLWQQGIECQSPRAMANLGMCYQLGHGVPQDTVEAARLYVMSIKSGNGTLFKQKLDSAATNVFDALLIAECYENGEGVKRDLSKAASLYCNAADMGSEIGICKAALCCLNCGDTVTAMEYLPRAAALGNIECQYWTGHLTIDTPYARSQAVDYILKAAEAGLPAAQDEAASLYAEGQYFAADTQKALTLFMKAAEQGYAPAMLHAATAYRDGIGTPVDYDKALYWLARASESGYQGDEDDALGTEEGAFYAYVQGVKALMVTHDYAAAEQWLKKSGKIVKTPNANVMLAMVQADTANPKSNTAKAVKALERLAPTSPQAAYLLAGIYHSGRGVPQDTVRAQGLYKAAEDSGYYTNLDCIKAFLK